MKYVWHFFLFYDRRVHIKYIGSLGGKLRRHDLDEMPAKEKTWWRLRVKVVRIIRQRKDQNMMIAIWIGICNM